MVAWLCAGLIAAAGCAPVGHANDVGPDIHHAADGQTTRSDVVEYWYRLEVDGTPAGWMLSRESVRGDKLTTISRLHLRFKRAATAQTFELDSRFVETLDGRPLRAWSRQTLGLSPVETTWKFLPHEILVDVVHGQESRRQRVPLPAAGWLTPGQIQPRLRQLLADGVRQFTVTSLDPQLGPEPVDTEWILDAEEEAVQIDGEAVPTRRFRQRQSFMPQLETVADVTAEGLVVRSTTPMMGFTMTSMLVPREKALESTDGPELLARTFIFPDRPIASPRRVRRARYEVRPAAGAPARESLLAALPSTGAQRVERTDDGTGVHVLVDLDSSPDTAGPGRARPAEGEQMTGVEPYLQASTFVDHRSPGVRRLLSEALGASGGSSSEPSPAARAETLRAFVAGHLRDKNLDSILATAGEVAASRSGDCTEHSVLLTALLRAAGIPARAVTGLVYVDALAGERDLFGYHMWTQAWIGDRWLDLDATLTVPFDAAHIAFGTTALNDDHTTLKELARLGAVIGQTEIRVLEISHSPSDP